MKVRKGDTEFENNCVFFAGVPVLAGHAELELEIQVQSRQKSNPQ